MSCRLSLDMVANYRILRCAFEWLVMLTPVTRVVNHHHVIYLKHLTICQICVRMSSPNCTLSSKAHNKFILEQPKWTWALCWVCELNWKKALFQRINCCFLSFRMDTCSLNVMAAIVFLLQIFSTPELLHQRHLICLKKILITFW